jgi:hypothetical protein
MVAAVTGPDGGFLAVHRTFLSCVNGRWGKAPLQRPKTVWPSFGGGAIRLWRGIGNPRASAERPGAALVITEGIEDALSVALASPEQRIWAMVSLSNPLALPAAFTRVTFVTDNADGRPQVPPVADDLLEQGRDVRMARLPAQFKDANDALRGVTQKITPPGRRAEHE